MKKTSSFAYCDHDSNDAVHDYERKAPLGNWEVRQMLRVQPPTPKNLKRDYIPQDTLDLIKALKDNRTSIIPTCDLPESYFHMSRHTDCRYLKIKVSQSEDEGWSRIEVDKKDGRLTEEIFKSDFPELYS